MQMLNRFGPEYLENLRNLIPEELRPTGALDIPKGLSEQDLVKHVSALASENATVEEYASFLGAGAYNHYVPSVVRHLAGRSEFYTSYTPYQPEISQGTLQAVFEYQTLICQLTGMDVSNASLYDGASATAEAVLMACRLRKKARKVMVSGTVHPEYIETIKTYLSASEIEVEVLPYSTRKGGETFHTKLEEAEDGSIACLVVQCPNFLGVIEDLNILHELVRSKGGLGVTVVTEPLSMAIIKPPSELGADIAVGEAASFGSPLGYGGPYLGFLATRDEFVRQMPGRIAGETTDADGKRSFCLTLATREQHIRRDRATSNICTNQGLSALQAAIHMAALGRDGLRHMASLNQSKACYLKDRLTKSKGIYMAFTPHFFNEFTVRFSRGVDVDSILDALLKEKIIGGFNLKRINPELTSHLLINVTELNSREDIDRLADKIIELTEKK